MEPLLHDCQNHRDGAIKSFRLGMEAQGSDHLVHFIDVLMKIMLTRPPDEVPQTNILLQEVLQAQMGKDYLRVADLLEYGGILPDVEAS